MKTPLVFDGHNDLLLRIHSGNVPFGQDGFQGDGGHQIDLAKAKAGGFGGGFFAIYVPNETSSMDDEEMNKPAYDLPLPEPVNWAEAARVAMSQAAILIRLEREGALRICRTTAEIRAAMEAGILAAVMHMEGAEAIDPEFNTLDVLYEAGLRSLGPVWSRPTIYGHGVPFRFPSTGDTGDGLTANGIRLIKKCNDLRILVDLSHLNEAGFWDVAKHSDAPLVATHSNAHALSTHSRNLTDRQLHAVRDSDGMVGLNFAVAFLRADGRMDDDTPIDRMIEHLDYLMEHLGEDRVGLGSDFDGAAVPAEIRTVAGLPALRAAMAARGYGAELITKLCHGNWLRVLDQTWGTASA
ncbi:dipeptidase [Phaeobacter sp. QD34_3]|uniref:dipeptidase n=1 Tax=unclassified Phaeobacter TaxID=2621772 RepID=UPI00237F156E|nr:MULTISPECIES: dipeptidase [unclassified Phaeobacter]MDE4132159.1 dipeptidase [Phaeobacter sp. QD34_3]MDE4135797.1 dipeptidase [Phaeobacter sp. QD34_24]